MKVDLKPNKVEAAANIVRGECFRYNNELYMRVEIYLCSSNIRMVNLRTGLVEELVCSTEVEPVNCKVVEDK